MTVEEVSEYLHVHPSTIYRLIKRRKIPAFRVGSDWRFNIETIDKWRSEMEAALRKDPKRLGILEVQDLEAGIVRPAIRRRGSVGHRSAGRIMMRLV